LSFAPFAHDGMIVGTAIIPPVISAVFLMKFLLFK
jgi:hypothetical protein